MTTYQINEKVFAYHDCIPYRGTVVALKKEDGIQMYEIKYDGWKGKKYNEWKDAGLLMKDTPESEEIRKTTVAKFEKNKRKSSKSASESTSKKRKPADDAGLVGAKLPANSNSRRGKAIDLSVKRKIILEIPLKLRKYLLDDYTYIKNKKHLVSLPVPPNISITNLLSAFQRDRESYLSATCHSVAAYSDTCEFLRVYFAKAVGVLLLYRLERIQYHDFVKKEDRQNLVKVYGAAHLLRLLSKLPVVLSITSASDAEIGVILAVAKELLEWMDAKSELLWAFEYKAAGPEYLQRYDSCS